MTPRTPIRAERPPDCPTCGRPVAWRGNPARPFCSVACKLVDLGGWLDERYRIPESPPPPDAAPEPPGRAERA